MNDKYYIEVEESATYPDSTCDVFYTEEPFDTLETAKKRGIEKLTSSDYGDYVRVYRCADNVLTVVCGYWRGDMTWTDLTGSRVHA